MSNDKAVFPNGYKKKGSICSPLSCCEISIANLAPLVKKKKARKSSKFHPFIFPFSFRYCKNPLQPSSISKYVSWKSPVYQGSAISPLLPVISSNSLIFPSGSPPKNSQHIPYISLIHSQNIIIFSIIFFCYLHCSLPLTGNPMFPQYLPCWRIYRIANPVPDFLCAGSRRPNQEQICDTLLLNHILQNKFCHRRTADIAVADK